MKTITIKLDLDNNVATEENNTKPWYVRAHANMKTSYEEAKDNLNESARQVHLERQVVKQTMAKSRAELDAEYVAQAKVKVAAMMLKRGIKVTFD